MRGGDEMIVQKVHGDQEKWPNEKDHVIVEDWSSAPPPLLFVFSHMM